MTSRLSGNDGIRSFSRKTRRLKSDHGGCFGPGKTRGPAWVKAGASLVQETGARCFENLSSLNL